jgi:hypothetical protein
MSIHKKFLAALTLRDGYKDDIGRSRFQETLERKYGRFAFPDEFSNGPLKHLREHARKHHNKDTDTGPAYRSVAQIRARAIPNFDDAAPTVGVLLVVDNQRLHVGREVVLREFNAVAAADSFAWPEKWRREEPLLFAITTLDEMSARE